MKLPKFGQHITFAKGVFAFYLIFLAVFFAAAPFLTLILYSQTDLTRSLLPQLIGFCLQGAFLVLVFAIYEKRSTLFTKRNHKYTLRALLSPLVSACSVASESAGVRFLPNPVVLENILQALREHGVAEEKVLTLKKVSKENVTTLESLAIVAAQIDYLHLEAWSTIIHQLAVIRDAEQTEGMAEAAVLLFENIQKFDELSIF